MLWPDDGKDRVDALRAGVHQRPDVGACQRHGQLPELAHEDNRKWQLQLAYVSLRKEKLQRRILATAACVLSLV